MQKRASADYIKLRKLLSEGYRIGNIQIDMGSEQEISTIELKKNGAEEKTLRSKEGDVALFGFSIKQTFNRQGERIMGTVKDIGLFYDNIEKLYDPDSRKFNEAIKEIIEGKQQLEYVPHDLLTRFLNEPNTETYKPYLKLRDDYYSIIFSHTQFLKQLQEGLTLIRKQKSQKTRIFNKVLKLYGKAFHKNTNFVKNYQLFQRYNTTDALGLLHTISEDLAHDKDKFGMLSKRKGVPAKQGLRYLIESYATLAETVIKILNIIRAAIELEEGVKNPKDVEKSINNWSKIKKNEKYGFIVEKFDPKIRHGKSHNNYFIDLENEKIDFYKKGKLRKVSVSYSFVEFKEMWQQMHILVSALIMATCVEQAILTAVLLRSSEYRILLATLGNFKKI